VIIDTKKLMEKMKDRYIKDTETFFKNYPKRDGDKIQCMDDRTKQLQEELITIFMVEEIEKDYLSDKGEK
jgi:hypothetical protein